MPNTRSTTSWRRELRQSLIVCVIVASCGGRTQLGSSNGSADATTETSSGPSGPCEADGVRICGGTCPLLDISECPGRGCTDVLESLSDVPTSLGLCWSDMRDGEGADACTACKDGDACVQRATNQLVCVPYEICAALSERGASSACRYADKAPFTGASLSSAPATCPATKPGTLCGGGCGDCPSWTLQRCTGRSATRPYGICPRTILANNDDPTNVATCAVDTNGDWTLPCPVPQMYDPPKDKPEPAVCLVFAGGDETAARAYGVCTPESDCQSINATLVGGVHCFSSTGLDVSSP